MYQISVPIMLSTCERYGTERYIERLSQMGAKRVFLAVNSYETDAEKRKKVLDALKKYVPAFKKAGFEVGVWLWAFMVEGDRQYTHITSPSGPVSANQVCPSDEAFCRFAAEYAADLAACGLDMILYDDDYRYGFLDCGLGCACKNHRAFMAAELGEPVPEEGLGKRIFGGAKNKYRSAFLHANAHFLTQFARQVRASVDRVNPSVRIGLCACMDVWDFCGVPADEISVLLAGKTKPFLRLIGAPYWSPNKNCGNRLQDVIDLTRMERAWCRDGIEIVSEGDCYPRPRFACSAARLECYDIALRAAGGMDGILKYVFDYWSSPDYEPGYIDRHLAHLPLYEKIETFFAGKKPVGVRVYEFEKKFENMTVRGHYDGVDGVQMTFFPPAARMVSACSLPAVFEGKGTCGVAFGENARYLTDEAIGGGLILDARAAEILQERGVDAGLLRVGGAFAAKEEYFEASGEYVNLNGSEVLEIEAKDGATVESEYVDGETRRTASYRYQNAAGQKFLVLGFDGYYAGEHSFKQYARAAQLRDAIRFFGGELPAFLCNCPDAYLICSRNGAEKAVLIGNFFDDALENAAVTVGPGYTAAAFAGCTGRLVGEHVLIDRIEPYAVAAFSVK